MPALGLEISTDQVELVTVDGVEREFRPMCNDTLMLIPSIGHKLRAQIVRVYLKGQDESPKVLTTVAPREESPKDTYGFTAPAVPYRGRY